MGVVPCCIWMLWKSPFVGNGTAFYTPALLRHWSSVPEEGHKTWLSDRDVYGSLEAQHVSDIYVCHYNQRHISKWHSFDMLNVDAHIYSWPSLSGGWRGSLGLTWPGDHGTAIITLRRDVDFNRRWRLQFWFPHWFDRWSSRTTTVVPTVRS